MPFRFRSWAALFCVFLPLWANAQVERIAPDSLIASLTARNEGTTIKLMPTAIVQGDAPILFERKLTNLVTLEAGIGVLFPWYTSGFYDHVSEGDARLERVYELDNPAIGRSHYAQLKIFPALEAPEGEYLGVQWRNRHFKFDNRKVIYTDITANFGFQWFVGKRFVVDAYSGLGARRTTNIFIRADGVRERTNREELNLVWQVNARFGIRF